MTRDGESLINVQRAFQHDLAFLEGEFVTGDSGDNEKLVIPKPLFLTLEVLCDSDLVAAARQIVSGVNTPNFPACDKEKTFS